MARCFVISGPSGVGKGTLCNHLMQQHAKLLNLVLSVSMTTRKPRPGEIDGVHYYFVSQSEFELKIQQGALLEWAQYNNHYYGTPKAPIATQLAAKQSVLLEIDPQGAFQVRQHFAAQAVLIFIAPPSIAVLKARLLDRQSNSPEDIEKRLQIATTELAQQSEFNVTIINDTLEQALTELVDTIQRYTKQVVTND